MTACAPALIRLIGRHGLATVPHFYDLATVETEQVHSRNGQRSSFWYSFLRRSSSGHNEMVLFAAGTGLMLTVYLLESLNVDLGHLKQCFHYPFCLLSILVLHHLPQNSGDDLP